QVCGDGKGQPDVHAAGKALHWRVDELLDPGKGHDLVELARDLLAAHAQDRAVQVDVFPTRQFGVEPRADFEQRGHPPVDLGETGRWLRNTRQDFEQRAFARAVAPD